VARDSSAKLTIRAVNTSRRALAEWLWAGLGNDGEYTEIKQ
jgi:hypothetical protein